MKIQHDLQADILYIELSNATIDESDEVAPEFIVDYDSGGKPVAFEILDASQIFGGRELKIELALAEGEPGVRRKAI